MSLEYDEDLWISGPEGREWKVWLVPEAGKGDLEEALWGAAVDDARRGCVEEFLRCTGDPKQFQTFSKTRLMAYLAVQPEPVPSITRVVQVSSEKSGIDLAHSSLDRLRQRIADL